MVDKKGYLAKYAQGRGGLGPKDYVSSCTFCQGRLVARIEQLYRSYVGIGAHNYM